MRYQPEFISPIVGYLASEQCEDSGTLQEVFGGYAAGVRWQRTSGASLPNDVDPTPEQIVAKWKEITTFGQSTSIVIEPVLMI
jgi:multifunctional beta-oxidation protein